MHISEPPWPQHSTFLACILSRSFFFRLPLPVPLHVSYILPSLSNLEDADGDEGDRDPCELDAEIEADCEEKKKKEAAV